MSFTVYTAREIAEQIAARVREVRLARGWTQAELAARTGVVLATYRQFERTGQVSLERLVAITSALGRAAEWDQMMKPQAARSLDELDPARPKRQRGIRRGA